MLRIRPFLAAGMLAAALAQSASAQEAAKDTVPAAPEKKTSEKWDVSRSLGPSKTLEFETSEGTWMNLDVSPDGRLVVFDLLGDIYVLPVEGGRATRISGGAPFDMQPRFSPDGKRIAFISDRDGLNNVWTMAPDGSDPRQVSKEKAQDVNSPAWSPDGEYVFARKHFVERRSLGAGEVWMYHVSGGSGLQVTERNGWQKDAGEPALSPDGRYLYYSKDVTPGQSFEYNKDPYAGIYAILRRDLTTGEERRVTGGPGGAITPLPAPDGKRLAFIRRVGEKTVLHLRDLSTGEEWPVFDRLDRDMQETWAIHGVYPQYAWTPDGKHLVVWGEGKIWKVDAERRTGVEIPFTARVEQTVHEGLRFAQEVSPERFPARMLRDVRTSPDGRRVAYGALGKVWVKQLPDGEPRRLTSDERMEFDPAFSPDGRRIVYTTWTDAGKGRVRVVGVNGRGGRDVVRTPGHYTEASFSPDGKWVVYRATTGDDIRGPTHGEEPGVYVVAADGSGEPRRVRRGGAEPQFDHTGKRIYLRESRGGKQVLLSVDLNGGDEVVHFESKNATQIVPSPDGRWVAFAERFHAYVGAFPRTGRTVELGPKVEGYPVTRISRDAGMYLHWSGDGTKVHWSLGPELFTRDLSESFAFVASGVEDAAPPEETGVPIGFLAKTDAPSGTVALVGARVVTVAEDGPQVIENGTVVVRGNRIAAVGPAAEVEVPAGAHRVDVSGKTIIPGLVDVHAHVGSEGSGILAEASWPLMANLAFGVTTAHDPSNATETVFSNAELVRAGEKLGPRLYSTGTILYGAETPFKAVVNSYEDALAHLRRMKAVGAFSVKSYNQRRRDARQMIVQAARELEMMVVPEGGSLLYSNESMVHDGHTGVEHALPAGKLYRDVVKLFGESTVGYTPTIIVGYGGIWGENYWYQHTNVWENEHLLTFTPRGVVDARSRRRMMAAEDDFNHVRIAEGAKAIADAGGLVNLGAHGQLQGLGAHWELWMFVQGGMTPLEALRVATLNGAKYVGLDRDLGSIEAGKLADLVVLDRNPLENIRNSESVRWVMLNGRLYDARTLNEAGNHPRTRPLLFWEREGGSGATVTSSGHTHSEH